MATVYETLKDRIVSNLQNVSEFDAANIFGYPTLDFTGYPACTLIPIPGDVDFETTAEDERFYKFMVTIYYPLKQNNEGTASTAIDALYNIADEVLDEFSTDRVFENGTPIVMPANTVYLMTNPVFAGWGQVDEKDLLACEIELNCRVSVVSSD